jgi:hypothetical protein
LTASGVVVASDVAEKTVGESVKIGSKVAQQMASRGWTRDKIAEAVQSGKQVIALNKANGNPAIRYIHPETGQSTVVDTVTNEVIHVGGPDFWYGLESGDSP